MMMNLMSALAETANNTAAATGEVAAAAPQTMAGGEIISLILPLVLMFALMYFLMIRPQKKKEKKVKNMLDALKTGDRICTIGGLYGTITSVKDDTVTIALGAKQNTVVIAKWAVRSVEDAPLENDAAPEI